MRASLPGIGSFDQQTDHDRRVWGQISEFVAREPRAFTRDPGIGGHITASVFLLSKDRSAVLLSLHAKLGIWIQLGGHCDGIADARFTAHKEAYEESGLSRIAMTSEDVFDVDIHDIPAFGDDPAHLHYDIRFLCQAEAGEIAISDESLDLKWIPLAALHTFSQEPSLIRMRDKAVAL